MSFVGGKLNLKGGASLSGGVAKDKKKKKHKKKKMMGGEEGEEGALALVAAATKEEGEDGGGTADPPPASAVDTRTEAQKRHDAALASREAARIRDLAAKSHRERVAEFNDKLASMSEHHDIPKVGPG